MAISSSEARDAGIPHGTSTADEWGFAWVRKFCEATGTRWMRPRAICTVVDTLREAWFYVLAITWISHMIAPSARRRAAGYEQGKPTSALLAVYAYRRVMRDCGRCTPDLAQCRAVLKGICARYKARWGDDAFVPERKQPFSTAHLLSIVTVLSSGAVADWSPVLCMAMLTAFCHAISTGARKDEWTNSFEGDSYVRRNNFAWVDEHDSSKALPSTPEVIHSRRNGSLLRGRSAPSKCDRLNIEWGSRDMWFRLDDTNPLNFAWRWQQWELRHPCPQHERAAWPAFSPDGGAAPFSGALADRLLRILLAVVMPAAEAARRSWHSCRVTIATRLHRAPRSAVARDEIEGVIQSLVRWKTPEAMRLYARIDPQQYASYVDLAANVTAPSDGSIPDGMCEVDPEGALAETAATLRAIEAESAAALKSARGAREAGRASETAGRAEPKRRRAAPATGSADAQPAPPVAPLPVFDIGDGTSVQHAGDDDWGLVGRTVEMHNSFWGHDGNETSTSKVVGYVGRHGFPNGVSKHTYIIECDGFCYPARHTAVRSALTDHALRRRLQNAQPPRVA